MRPSILLRRRVAAVTTCEASLACLVLDEPGEILVDLVTPAIEMRSTWNRIDAQRFVSAAEEAYCHNKLPRGACYPICSPDEGPAASFEAVGLGHGHRRPRSDGVPRAYEVAGGRVDRLAEANPDLAGRRHPRTVDHPARLGHPSQPGPGRTAGPLGALPYERYERCCDE